MALWRESLLAQRVLAGRTRGYREHPQLDRFKQCADPLAAIGAYLAAVYADATDRGYAFDWSLVSKAAGHPPISATAGQLLFEAARLRGKLAARDPARLERLGSDPDPHPLFRIVPGPVEPWERPRT